MTDIDVPEDTRKARTEPVKPPRVGSPVVFRAQKDGPEFVVSPCSGKHRALWLARYVVLSCPKCNASLRKLDDEVVSDD